MSAATLSADEARQKIHKTVRSNIPFEEKAHKALELGKQYLGVENGYLTRIDEETDHWEIVVTSDTTDSQVPPGFELDLQETYCRKTITDESPLALHDAPNQGWAEDPAVETSGQQTYLGIPLITDEEPYGTVCFVAEDAQSDSFSEAETQFADHLTRLLERELEKEYIKDDLTNQTNLATVLNRVLRHNLRNDITVIRGYTKLMAEQLDDDHAAKTVLDNIDDLIDLTQKARELEEVITTNSERQATEIGTLIEDIAAEIRQDYPAASIDVEYDYDIQGGVMQNFDRAIKELIENAVKHSGNDPRVTVAIETVPNAIEIQIRDNGPGLQEDEAEVFTTGEETPLAHGSGLGLWLAYWIITSHDGSIDPEITQYGTTMNVTIPRKPTVTAQERLTEVTRSRDKYKRTVEEAVDSIVITDDEGRIIEANDAASAIHGAEAEELLGRSITEFLPDDFAFESEWQNFQETGSIKDTTTFIGVDGVERVIEYSATADIIPGQHLFISRDITDRKERERELEVAETVFQNTQDALVLVDVVDEQEYHLNRVNDAFLAVTPHSRENISGMTPREMLGDEVGSDIQSQFTECVRTQQRVEFEQVVPAEDGRRIWQVQVTPVIQDDEVTQLVLVMRNITESRERKLELETTTQRLQLALEGTGTGVWEWEPETKNVRLSESLERLVGIEPGTFKGTFDAFAEYVHPDDRQQAINAVEQAVETGSRYQTEYRLQRANGGQIWVEARGEVHDDGETNRMVGIVTDISDRKEREADLARKTEAMEKAPIGITLTDPSQPDNPMVYANERFCELTGYEEDEILGQNCRFMQGPETDPERVAEIRDAIDNEESMTTVFRNYRADGTMFWNLLTIAPVGNADGEVNNWVGFQKDVTERIEREHQLKLAETVFENTQDALFVIDVTENQEFYVERVNAVYEALTGLSNVDIAGKTPTEIVGDEIGSEIESQYRECVERQETIKYPEEIPVDGEQRQWETKVTPVFSEGRVDKLVGAMRDVTTK